MGWIIAIVIIFSGGIIFYNWSKRVNQERKTVLEEYQNREKKENDDKMSFKNNFDLYKIEIDQNIKRFYDEKLSIEGHKSTNITSIQSYLPTCGTVTSSIGLDPEKEVSVFIEVNPGFGVVLSLLSFNPYLSISSDFPIYFIDLWKKENKQFPTFDPSNGETYVIPFNSLKEVKYELSKQTINTSNGRSSGKITGQILTKGISGSFEDSGFFLSNSEIDAEVSQDINISGSSSDLILSIEISFIPKSVEVPLIVLNFKFYDVNSYREEIEGGDLEWANEFFLRHVIPDLAETDKKLRKLASYINSYCS